MKRRKKDTYTARIRIRGLTKAQLIAIEDMLATWVNLGNIGSSRWTAFYADGDGNFRPEITVNGRRAGFTKLVDRNLLWADGDYKMDFDMVSWKLREGEEVKKKRRFRDLLKLIILAQK